MTVNAMERYSIFTDDFDTMVCSFYFHDIKKSLKKTHYPLVNLCVSRLLAQSASGNALRWKDDEDGKNKFQATVFLIYWRIWNVACKWGALGLSRKWLNLWTIYVICSLVKVRYNNHPLSPL